MSEILTRSRLILTRQHVGQQHEARVTLGTRGAHSDVDLLVLKAQASKGKSALKVLSERLRDMDCCRYIKAIDKASAQSLRAVDALLAGEMDRALQIVHAQPPRPKPPRPPKPPAPAGAPAAAPGPEAAAKPEPDDGERP